MYTCYTGVNNNTHRMEHQTGHISAVVFVAVSCTDRKSDLIVINDN